MSCENCERLERERGDADAERNVAQAHSALVEEMLFSAGYRYEGETFPEFVKRAWGEQRQRTERAEAEVERLERELRAVRTNLNANPWHIQPPFQGCTTADYMQAIFDGLVQHLRKAREPKGGEE